MTDELLAQLPQDARRRLPILRAPHIKDCRSCGACCTHYVVDVLSTDPNLQWLKENGYMDGSRLKQGLSKRCVALIGEVGEEVSCSIYEHRPESCRTYEVGGKKCLEVVDFHIQRC